MTIQMSIFDQPPFQRHSATSRDAAESMRGKTARIRDVVFETLRNRPMTDEELINEIGISQNTVRPRRVELAQRGLIAEVGKRPTSSGRMAVVWGVNND